MLFHKCGCLVAHGKYIFRKCFSVWPCVGCKMISVFILPSNIIFWKTERERVSEIAPAHKERERAHRRRPTSFDFVSNPETSCHEPTNQSLTSPTRPEPKSRHEPRAFDPPIFDPKPLTSLETHKPISLSVRFWFLCDFDFCCCCGGVGGGVLVVFLLCGGGFCLLAVGCGFWLPEFATMGWIGVSVVCGVVSVVGINFSGCGLLLMVASDGYLAVDWDLAVILKFSVIKFV